MPRKPLAPPPQPTETVVLSPEQSSYLHWLTDPDRVGTKQDQADILNVHRSTITRWEQNGAFRKAWADKVQELGGDPDRVQRVYDVLYGKALEGDTRSAELWLKAIGKLQQAQETAPRKSVRDLSDAELAEYAAELAQAEKTRRSLRVVGADA